MMYFIWLALFFILGLGYREGLSLVFATTVVFALLVWAMLNDLKLSFPKLLCEYLGFLAIFLVSVWWSKNQMVTAPHWLLFASVPFVWIFASSHLDWLKKHVFSLLLVLGLLYFIMTILTQTLPALSFLRTTPRGLVGNFSANGDHFMLGDYWGVLLSMLAYRYFHTKKTWLLSFIGLGMIIVLFSLSRSALVGFILAMLFYFIRTSEVSTFWKKVFWVFAISATLYMATQKSLLLNRPYYIQAILGFFAYPFGVGVGNFDLISKDVRFHILGLSGFSRVTHSIFLEFMSGMGVFVVYFWWWCYRIYTVYFEKVKLSEYSLALIALVVNFAFNPTYFVTPMLWLFALLLPLARNIQQTQGRIFTSISLVVTAMILLVGGLFIVVG